MGPESLLEESCRNSSGGRCILCGDTVKMSGVRLVSPKMGILMLEDKDAFAPLG